MRILVACEFSGIVRNAFRARGHDAWSCDLLETEKDPYLHIHLRRPVESCLSWSWDLMVAFPPCTHLASSGARWFKNKEKEQAEALRFVRDLMAAPIHKIAIENPIGVISTQIRKPDQIIQPWQYGHGETKATCLWLKNLPALQPTKIVSGRKPRIYRLSALQGPGSSRDRQRNRSRTYQGIAEAMAEQWGQIPRQPVSLETSHTRHSTYSTHSTYKHPKNPSLKARGK